MQVSIDGMVAAQRGHAHFNWDDEVRQYSIANAANVDCILLGRKTATDFIPHWKRLGVPSKIIQAILRHSNVSVTESYYIKTTESDAVAAMEKFAAEISAHEQSDTNRTLNESPGAKPKSVN
jgi:hypothetical protein